MSSLQGRQREGPLSKSRCAWVAWSALVAGALLGWTGSACAGFTLVGTAVTQDSWTGVPNVRVTLFPESLTVVTDSEGDFFIPWKGTRGWLTFVASEKNPDGKDWCKRYTLFPHKATKADSTIDIGRIYVTPGARLSDAPAPIRPTGTEIPPILHVAGPKAGQSDSCWVRVRYFTDPWGKAGKVEQIGGDAEPRQVIDAITRWIRSVPWKVGLETRCWEKEPISAILPFGYVWQDTGWVYTPSMKPRGQRPLNVDPMRPGANRARPIPGQAPVEPAVPTTPRNPSPGPAPKAGEK